MATLDELGVKKHDFVTFPRLNPGNPGYNEADRHTAEIVGPASFPKSADVYLSPPEPDRGFTIYNPKTDKTRPAIEIAGFDDDSHYHPGGPSPLQEGEKLIQYIHTRYTLFERA